MTGAFLVWNIKEQNNWTLCHMIIGFAFKYARVYTFLLILSASI